jgi:hypothetical protein
MGEMNFTEDDKQKFVEFLNMIAKTARFDVNTGELIQYFKLLSHMQTKMIPKIDANILEVLKVVENKEQPK